MPYNYTEVVRYLSFLLFVFASVAGTAQDIFQLHNTDSIYAIGIHTEYLEDQGYNFNQIRSASYSSLFEQSEMASLSFPVSDKAYWVRFKVNDVSTQEVNWLLQLDAPLCDTVDLFLPNMIDGSYRQFQTGQMLPFSTRLIDHESFLFPLELLKDHEQTVYMRIKTSGVHVFPLKIQTEAKLIAANRGDNLFTGLFVGVFIIMILFNLGLYWGVREATYLYYVGFMSSFLMVHLCMKGFAYGFFWSDSPFFENVSNQVFSGTTAITAGIFAWFYLDVKNQLPRLYRMLYLPIGVGTLLVVTAFISMYNYEMFATSSLIASINAGVGAAVLFLVGLLVFFKKYRPAKFYLIGWSAFLLGVVAFSMKNSNLLPHNSVTEYAIQIGAILELILLSMGLADRINQNELEKRTAREELIATLRDKEALISTQNERLEKEVKERTIEITEQKNAIEAKNNALAEAIHEIRAKNEHIISSINYALRIQNAILPSTSALRRTFSDHFIFFKPRDIVSGDFYWFGEMGEKRIVIAADCTGHGVPGAFMTVIGNNLLNEIINKRQICDPANILYELDKGVINTFSRSEDYSTGDTEEDQKRAKRKPNDGMDMSILVHNTQTNEISFAGAKSPLYFVRQGEMQRIKGSKYPIGSSQFKSKEFTTHKMQAEPDDIYYIFSDGFQDQFGDKVYKKFMTKRFRNLLEDNSKLTLKEQESQLHVELDDWQGARPQTDDILVIGLKL